MRSVPFDDCLDESIADPAQPVSGAGSLERTLRRLALAADAAHGLLLRPQSDHRFVTTLAIAGPADRFEARRMARAATTRLLAAPRRGAAPAPMAMTIDGAPCLVQWLTSGEGLALVLARRPGCPAFTGDERIALQAQIAWLEDVVELWWQNERGQARAAGLRAALGRSDLGAVLIDRNFSVVDINPAAERLLQRGQGITRRGRGVEATHPEDAKALRMAIHATILGDAAAAPAPRHIPLRRGANQRPLLAAVLRPFDAPPMRQAADDPAAMILIVDPEAMVTSVGDACAIYGLTAGETRLAEALCSGKTLAEAAVALGLQRESVRTYLRRIFAKTGVVRQAGLIQLLMNSRMPAAPSRAAVPAAPRPPLRPPVRRPVLLRSHTRPVTGETPVRH